MTVAELAGVLAEDLTGRATDVAQWAQRLLDEGAPPERLVGAIQWSQFWTRHGGDEVLVEHDTVRLAPLRGDTSVTPEQASAAEDA